MDYLNYGNIKYLTDTKIRKIRQPKQNDKKYSMESNTRNPHETRTKSAWEIKELALNSRKISEAAPNKSSMSQRKGNNL